MSTQQRPPNDADAATGALMVEVQRLRARVAELEALTEASGAGKCGCGHAPCRHDAARFLADLDAARARVATLETDAKAVAEVDEVAHRLLDAALGEGSPGTTSAETLAERLSRLTARLAVLEAVEGPARLRLLVDLEVAHRKDLVERVIPGIKKDLIAARAENETLKRSAASKAGHEGFRERQWNRLNRAEEALTVARNRIAELEGLLKQQVHQVPGPHGPSLDQPYTPEDMPPEGTFPNAFRFFATVRAASQSARLREAVEKALEIIGDRNAQPGWEPTEALLRAALAGKGD